MQLPPLPLDAGSDQGNGLVKGALKTTLPPHELLMVSVPLAGKQPVVSVPDNTYVPAEQLPGVAVSILQLGAVYVVGKTVGAPPAEKTALTVQLFPFPQTGGSA